MRVVYLHQYFNTPEMSGGTRSYEMARRLVEAGHEVEMVTSDRDPARAGSGWRIECVDGIRVHWLPVPYGNRMGKARRIRAFLRFALGAARRAASLDGNVVFATSTPLTIALPGAWAAWRRGVPMVFEVRDLWPEMPIAVGALRNSGVQFLARALERWAYRRSARVVALSPAMAEGVAAAGVAASRIAVVPNAADLDLFDVPDSAGEAFLERHPDLPEGPLVVYAGALGRINGVGYLVEMAGAMAGIDPSVGFLVAGDGREREEVLRRARQLGVLGRGFHWTPPLPKAEVPALLSASTVASSLVIDLKPAWKNSANKFFDALAAGRPVLINYGGWQAELLRETGAGLVLPPGQPVRAARLLHDLLSSPTRVREMGRAARRLAEERFGRDRLARRLQGVLEEAVREAGS